MLCNVLLGWSIHLGTRLASCGGHVREYELGPLMHMEEVMQRDDVSNKVAWSSQCLEGALHIYLRMLH